MSNYLLHFQQSINLYVTPFTKPGVQPCPVKGSRLAISVREEGKGRDSSTPLRFAQNDMGQYMADGVVFL